MAVRYPVVVTQPDDPVPSVEEVRAHLNVDGEERDDEIESMIWGAITEFEDPQLGWLGRSILLRQLELRLDAFCGSEIDLPNGPLVIDGDHAVSIEYDDANDVPQTYAAASYRVVDPETSCSRILLKSGQSWPSVSGEEQCIRVRYWVGYADDDVRINNFKSAVKLHVESTFDGVTDEERSRLVATIYRLLQPYRVYR